MKNKVKKVIAIWGKYFVITYTLYGLSVALKNNVEITLRNIRAKNNGEDPEMAYYEPLLITAHRNFKELGKMFMNYMEES